MLDWIHSLNLASGVVICLAYLRIAHILRGVMRSEFRNEAAGPLGVRLLVLGAAFFFLCGGSHVWMVLGEHQPARITWVVTLTVAWNVAQAVVASVAAETLDRRMPAVMTYLERQREKANLWDEIRGNLPSKDRG